MSANWTEKEWRNHIENRRRDSTGWQFIHALGSLRLAMLLLFTILIACAIATIYESKFNAQVAQAYIYKSQWFTFWLAVLCVNLLAVTLTRWPWRPKHYGFVITHYGIIILLIGAAVGQKAGFEANITLRVGDPPSRDLVVNRTVLQVQGGRDLLAYKVPIDVAVKAPRPESPFRTRLPDSPLRLVVDSYSLLEERDDVIPSAVPQQGSGVALEFSSAMMGQSLPVNLLKNPLEARKNDFFGRARVELLDALPDRSGTPPPEKEVKETQMVLSLSGEAVITPHVGEASGYRFGLVIKEEGEPEVVIEIPGMPTPGGPQMRRETYPLSAVLEKPFTPAGEALEIHVRNYWPDMEMENGRPVTRSQEPKNPALLVTLSGEKGSGRPHLEVAVHEEEGGEAVLLYQTSRNGVLLNSGKVAPGDSFHPGWADWKVTVKSALPNAMAYQRLIPIDGDPATSEKGVPGVRAKIVAPGGEEGEPLWVPSGRGVSLRLGQETAFVGFGLEVYKLPFTLELLSFEVPRHRGSTKPSDFRATVRFRDDATQAHHDALIHMNHPAGFPVSFLQTAFGRNYKFSQARWNAEDLNETTLQVLHDPGWPAKWFGSILICVGIAVMFYAPKPSQGGKGRSRQKRALQEQEVA